MKGGHNKAPLVGPQDPRHGTVTAYNNHGCRCPRCTEAARVARAAWRASLQDRPSAEIPHGTWSGYANWGCRCNDCKAAAALIRERQRSDYTDYCHDPCRLVRPRATP